MTIAARRQKLMIYLADAENKKVNELYSLLKDDLKTTSFTLTDNHLNILEERRNDRLSGKSKPMPWREVHEKIKNKRKRA